MSDPAHEHYLIIGAGLAGSLLACMLAGKGRRVSVYEQRPDPRQAGFKGGRSINLALSIRGIEALRRVGLDAPVLADAVRMPGRMIHSQSGDLAFQPYSANADDAINSVSRGGLNKTLIEAAAKYDNVSLHFDYRCIDVDLDAPAAIFEHEGRTLRVEADSILGADGAFSALRARMQRQPRFDYSQSYLAHGYKELSIPARLDGSFAMERNALHIWPRGGSMMIALPNADGSFTCTLFWPFEGRGGFAEITDRASCRAVFERIYPDAVPLMPTLDEDYFTNPTSTLVTVRCFPWAVAGRALLLGDAAHAIVPFYGQGMNAAFEDCAALIDCLERHDWDRQRAFADFQQQRKPQADAIADLALDNFIEMRDKVASRAFRARKKMEKALHRLFPRWYTPLYHMVTFTTIPYAEARRRSQRQDRAVTLAITILFAMVFLALLLGLQP